MGLFMFPYKEFFCYVRRKTVINQPVFNSTAVQLNKND